jgi:Flp pilus assembly protein TadB
MPKPTKAEKAERKKKTKETKRETKRVERTRKEDLEKELDEIQEGIREIRKIRQSSGAFGKVIALGLMLFFGAALVFLFLFWFGIFPTPGGDLLTLEFTFWTALVLIVLLFMSIVAFWWYFSRSQAKVLKARAARQDAAAEML